MSLLLTTVRRAARRAVARRAVGVGVITNPTMTIIPSSGTDRKSSSNKSSSITDFPPKSSSARKTSIMRFSSLRTEDNIEDNHLVNPQDHQLCNEDYQGVVQIAETPNGKGLGVFASRNFEAGERIMTARATRSTTVRDAYTVQRDWDSHVMMDLPAVLINHSCSANVGIRNSNSSVSNNNTISSSNNNNPPVFDFWAIRSISEGEELTWDYEASEWELSTHFKCQCGSRDCRGKVKGFKHSGGEIQKRYGEYIIDYLKDVDENNK